MTNKDLVLQAIEKLRQIKKIPICLIDFVPDDDNLGSFIIQVYNNIADEQHNIYLDGAAFTDEARAQNPEEPINLPFNELRIVRIARVIFDYYELHPWQNSSQNLNGSSTITLNSAPMSNTLNVSSISIGNSTIYSNTITDLEDKVNDLCKELDDVKAEKNDLLIKIMTLEAELKTKGII